jgi:hypothetical protein
MTSTDQNSATYPVGYKRPPEHTRFRPGQSGNPSGRPRNSKNLKTLLHTILNEQISLQDGAKSRKVSKAEAIMRRLIVGALKGDARDLHALFRLAEQTGEFNEDANEQQIVQIVRFSWQPPQPDTQPQTIEQVPAIRPNYREL